MPHLSSGLFRLVIEICWGIVLFCTAGVLQVNLVKNFETEFVFVYRKKAHFSRSTSKSSIISPFWTNECMCEKALATALIAGSNL